MDGDNAIDKARLERAIMVMAEIVAQHGPRYAMLLERLKREYNKLAGATEYSGGIVDRSQRSRGKSRKAIR